MTPEMENSRPLDSALFERLEEAPVSPAVEVSTRLEGWSRIFSRVRSDKPAMLSLVFLFLSVLWTVVGPWLWSLDPDLQNFSQLAEGPQMGRWARVVDPGVSRSVQPPAQGIRIEEANTESVLLSWAPIPSAIAVRIYRSDRQDSDHSHLGMPLARLIDLETAYQDRLNLHSRPYFYSVVAEYPDREELVYGPVSVFPEQAISRYHVELMGLNIAENDSGEEQVLLPAHPLGTDQLGRDILARLTAGARTSLLIGIVAPLLFVGLGFSYGALAAYQGGWLDEIMMRVADFVIGLPFLLFMILFKVVFGLEAGSSGLGLMLFCLVILSWPESARLVRGQILQLRRAAYVEASRLFGAGSLYVIFRHMLPQMVGTLLVTYSFAVPAAIFTEAFLSFIGMGIVPPTASWGNMCNEGMRSIFNSPHILAFPALAISCTVLAFNQLGDSLRDAFDTTARETETIGQGDPNRFHN